MQRMREGGVNNHPKYHESLMKIVNNFHILSIKLATMFMIVFLIIRAMPSIWLPNNPGRD